ncbi:MAG: hypothetical protein Q7T26_06920 [Dehalococcoidia bacterium]|nr:hypothetical protein [Dehalococcoidia bacterium]
MAAAVVFAGASIWMNVLWLRASQQLSTTLGELASTQQQLTTARNQLLSTQQDLTDAKRTVSSQQSQITDLASKLTTAQQDLSSVKVTLERANQSIARMTAEIADLRSPPLTAGQPVSSSGTLNPGKLISIPLDLNRFEQVQGEIIQTNGGNDMKVYIQDPAGAMVRDFGTIRQSNFKFTAESAGRYSLVIQNNCQGNCQFPEYIVQYNLRYVVYKR